MRWLPLAWLLLSVSWSAQAEKPRPASLRVHPPNEIEFAATVNAAGFDRGFGMTGYHAIVWKDGRAADKALFVAEVSDTQALDALESLGARPGPTLPMEAWEQRKSSTNRAPDTVISGPAVEVLLRLPGRRDPVPLAALLGDAAGRGLDLRLGGNRANIPIWRSGCIACLYSCPGSKVGNAKYTERDYARGTTRFQTRPGVLPPDGTRVEVVLRILR